MGNGYWEKRYLKDKAAMINRSEKYIEEQQRKYYVQAQKEIKEDIESLYQKFADKEKITLAEAKRQISRADFAKIDFEKMVDYQIEQNQEFRKKKGTLPGDVIAAIEKQHARYETGLRAYTKKGQITRLELLDLQIDKALLDLYDKNQISMYDCLARIYEDGYYRSIFAGQKAIRFGKDFAVPNTRAVERAVLNTYSKKGYSNRLYGHCKTFSKDLKENLVTGFIKGESIDKMTARISRRLNVSEANARRLVRTETAYVYEQASLQAYQACGIEMYEFMAMLDHKTSPPCQALDGKRFLIKDAVPGKNYPPMHPNCRSTTVAAFEDDKITKRLAKDELGKYYEVPSDMNYPEWKKAYGGGGKKENGQRENIEKEDNAVSKYERAKSYYEDRLEHLSKLQKESDKLLDSYMDVMDSPDAGKIEAALEEKMEEIESFKLIIKDLKAQLSGEEAKAVRHLEKDLAVKTGIPDDKIKMTGLPYDSAKTIYDSYKTVLKQYPELRSNLSGFLFDGKISSAYAGCNAMTGQIKAHDIFKNFPQLVQEYADDVAAGFHPAGTDYKSIIVHELGHALDGYMTKKGLFGGNIKGDVRSSTEVSRMVLAEAGYVTPSRAELKKKGYTFGQINDILIKDRTDFITKHISRYASGRDFNGNLLTDYPARELFAECFAEYIMSDNPREAAKAFGKIINRALGH